MEAAVEGAREVGAAVLASTLTTVAVFIPVIFIEGFAAQIFTDLSLTVSFSLISSLVVSMTLVPLLASRMLAGKLSGLRRSRQPSNRPPGDEGLPAFQGRGVLGPHPRPVRTRHPSRFGEAGLGSLAP